MMHGGSLDDLLWRFSSGEDDARIVGPEEIGRWPRAMLAELKRLALIVEHSPANRVACPACELGHVEDLKFSGDAEHGLHAVIPCPVFGRVEIEDDALRRWRLRDDELTTHLQGKEDRGGSSEVVTWDGTTLTVNRTAFGSTQSVKPVQLLERAADFQLVREGRGWSAAFNAMPMKGLPDLKGFRDIQVLLGRPRQPVPVTDFADVLLVENGVALITAADLKSLRTFCGKYDARDKDVEKYLRQVCRMDGRPRLTASPLNKAAAAVRNRIDRAIREIGKESVPMAQHLDQWIKKGLVLSYRPSELIPWEL